MKKILIATSVLTFVGILWGILWYLGVFAPQFQEVQGKAIDNITLHDTTGRRHGFEELRGKQTYIYFWTSWCSPCIQALSHLKKLPPNDSLAKNFVAVALDQNIPALKQGLKKSGFQGVFWIAENGTFLLQQRAFGSEQRSVPFVLLLDEEGRIISHEYGIQDYEKFIEQLRK